MQHKKDDLPPEAANAVLLNDAFFALCNPEIVERYHAATIRKKKYEASIDHEDLRRMGRVYTYDSRFKKEVNTQLQAIKTEFLQKLKDGVLTAWAREGSPLAPMQKIPASAWSMLWLKSLPKNLVHGLHGDLYDVRIVNNAPHDVLPRVKGRGGRPSEKDTIIEEYKRRKKEGLCEDSRRGESHYLEKWFKENFPSGKTPCPKTIQNHISGFEKALLNKIK